MMLRQLFANQFGPPLHAVDDRKRINVGLPQAARYAGGGSG
jgi:hypothetical protein